MLTVIVGSFHYLNHLLVGRCGGFLIVHVCVSVGLLLLFGGGCHNNLLLGVMHLRELQLIGHGYVNRRIRHLPIPHSLELINQVIGRDTVVIVRGLRGVPPGCDSTGPLAHGL